MLIGTGVCVANRALTPEVGIARLGHRTPNVGSFHPGPSDRPGRLVSSSLDAIRQVVAAFERSDWTEIDVRVGDVRVHLATGTPPDVAPASAPAGPAVVTSAAPVPVHDSASGPGEPAPPPAGAHLVLSPSPGIFWRSPEPGAPPFADIGQTIDAATTMCIVEVMKLMNHLKAGIGGTVVAVYGRDGVAVERGEPLFAIAPSPGGPTD